MENIIEELRIGNYISFINRNGEYHIPSTHPLKIYSVSAFKIEVCQINENFVNVEKMIILDVNHLVGIPLTEDWLIKFGFEKRYNKYTKGNYFTIDEFGLYIVELDKCYAPATLYDNIQFFRKGINIIYVHQLQNLYFVLTGKTLMI